MRSQEVIDVKIHPLAKEQSLRCDFFSSIFYTFKACSHLATRVINATGVTATDEVFTLACDAGDSGNVCLPFLVVVSQLQRDLTGVLASIGVELCFFLDGTKSENWELCSDPASNWEKTALTQRLAKTWPMCMHCSVLGKMTAVFLGFDL